ncbi:putative type IV pilin [Tolumonas auensis DSM 9187]|uniref:Putative type IV pilin n=1 Tax=Tolumonas auensis (strain DSM 9187 / NBRC 110442 / TA 4) TaxID=595494 RepID=C4LAD5_TOLAT|nr:prepilin-type N-terminal cleavage/methylation domain-containing protein [Tolumonas auensis]ACQ94110.1 putative type IV pilin [Tolumonas auensis DSM 9187]
MPIFLKRSGTIQKSKGFSLIELMVAMVIGLFVAAIMATMYVSIIRANSTTVQLSRLNMDMQSALDIIARDIQRTGYASGAEAALERDSAGNPTSSAVSSAVHTAMFSAYASDGSALDLQNNCVLLRYDANDDGSITGGANPPEIIAYSYVSGASSVVYQEFNTAGSQSCTVDNTWQVLAGGDGHLDITGLTFTLDPVSGAFATSGAYNTTGQRFVRIRIAGRSSTNNDIQLRLDRRVRLQNDQF